jgi:LacI family transcriptional regulator
LVGNSDGDPAKEENYYRTFVAKRVDGLVLITCPMPYPPAYLSRHNSEETPVVLINRDYPGLRADTVLSDSQEGSCRAVSHLLASGYRRVAIITGPAHHVSSQQRLLGYKRALLEHGVPVETELIREGRFDTRSDTLSGYENAKALLNLPEPPEAMFVCNAAMSMAALRAIFDRGLRCPQDIGLVSFDDLEWFKLIHPRVSAVAQPAYELGAAAANILMKRVAGERVDPPHRTVLETKLFVRETSVRTPVCDATEAMLTSQDVPTGNSTKTTRE